MVRVGPLPGWSFGSRTSIQDGPFVGVAVAAVVGKRVGVSVGQIGVTVGVGVGVPVAGSGVRVGVAVGGTGVLVGVLVGVGVTSSCSDSFPCCCSVGVTVASGFWASTNAGVIASKQNTISKHNHLFSILHTLTI